MAQKSLKPLWTLSTTSSFLEEETYVKADGLGLNPFGSELLASNLTYFLTQVPVGNSVQQESFLLISQKPEGQLQPTETLMEPEVQMNDKTSVEAKPQWEDVPPPQPAELELWLDPLNLFYCMLLCSYCMFVFTLVLLPVTLWCLPVKSTNKMQLLTCLRETALRWTSFTNFPNLSFIF